MNALETINLSKRYGARYVLREVSLTMPAGAIFGFLGPNGAGKTTTIRILLGLLRASAGKALLFGEDAWRQGARLRRDIGYLPGDVRFYDWFTGRATLDFFNVARGGCHGDEIRRLQRVFDLELDRKVRRYSRGMKQKLGLIQALMHRPRLLILDEPTTALDPLVREALYEELRRVSGEGRSILFSSHTLTEVEELCDEVAIVRGGRIIEHEKIAVLKGRAVRHVEVQIPAGATLPSLPGDFRVEDRADGKIKGAWTGPIQPLLNWLALAPIEDVSIAPPDLEDLFMAYYAENGREPAA